MKPDRITLIDEMGAERAFLLHDAIEREGATYYLVEAAGDPEQVLLLKEVGEGLESVEPSELTRVLASLESEP